MAAPEAPFAPLPDVPDYVATMFVTLYHGPTYREIRTHHRGWMRVDGSFDRSAYRSTSYFGPGPLFVTFAREPSAQVEGHDWLQIERGPAMFRLIRWSGSPFKTGDSQTWLDESCQVWDLSGPLVRPGTRPGAKHLSCVTPDGIELWSRGSGTSFEATAIKRQQVIPNEVQPPRDRLDLKSWLTAPSGATPRSDLPGDITVVLENEFKGSDDQLQIRTVRRHYPWTHTEDLYGNGRRTLTFRNELERLDIYFDSSPSGEPIQLSIRKALRDFRTNKRPDTGPTETVLGEQCFRFEDRHRHGHLSQCITADGLVLKHSSSGMEGRKVLAAVKIDRSSVMLDAVQPPPFIFATKTWGIPDE